MADEDKVIRPLDEGVLHKGGQRPKPQTPRPTANPAGQRPDKGKPADNNAGPNE